MASASRWRSPRWHLVDRGRRSQETQISRSSLHGGLRLRSRHGKALVYEWPLSASCWEIALAPDDRHWRPPSKTDSWTSFACLLPLSASRVRGVPSPPGAGAEQLVTRQLSPGRIDPRHVRTEGRPLKLDGQRESIVAWVSEGLSDREIAKRVSGLSEHGPLLARTGRGFGAEALQAEGWKAWRPALSGEVVSRCSFIA